jgi:hypothetical protein
MGKWAYRFVDHFIHKGLGCMATDISQLLIDLFPGPNVILLTAKMAHILLRAQVFWGDLGDSGEESP